MNLETKITIYKFTPQVFTLTPFVCLALFCLLFFSLFCLFSWGQQIFSGDYSYTCEVFLFLCF